MRGRSAFAGRIARFPTRREECLLVCRDSSVGRRPRRSPSRWKAMEERSKNGIVCLLKQKQRLMKLQGRSWAFLMTCLAGNCRCIWRWKDGWVSSELHFHELRSTSAERRGMARGFTLLHMADHRADDVHGRQSRRNLCPASLGEHML